MQKKLVFFKKTIILLAGKGRTMSQMITIDLPAKVSTNTIYSGVHWQERKKLKDLFLWAFIGHRKALQPIKKGRLYFDFCFKRQPLDCSNCTYMAKMLEDCLTFYGIIKDDKPDIITGINITSRKGTSDTVTITLEEIQ